MNWMDALKASNNLSKLNVDDYSGNPLINLAYENISKACGFGNFYCDVMVFGGISKDWFEGDVVISCINHLSSKGFKVMRCLKVDGHRQNYLHITWL